MPATSEDAFNQPSVAMPSGVSVPTPEQVQQAAMVLVAANTSVREAYPDGGEMADRVASLFQRLMRGEAQGPQIVDRFCEDCPGLLRLKADFEKGLRQYLPDGRVVRAEISWETVEERLLDDDARGLKLAEAMQGGGELFGVDFDGRLLISDRGPDDVMYGWDREADELIQVYNRDPEQMARCQAWANFYEVTQAVCGSEDNPTGYEMFPDTPERPPSPESLMYESFTRHPFYLWQYYPSARGKGSRRRAHTYYERAGEGIRRLLRV